MAVIHDIGESIIGDITPHDGVTKQEKAQKEHAAVKKILNNQSLYELWLDFDEGKSAESRLVKQLDKIEAYLQAHEYNLEKHVIDEFCASAKNVITDDVFVKLINKLEKTDPNKT